MSAPRKHQAPAVTSVPARILDRPNAAFYGDMPRCDCDGCAAIRARGFFCTACGFQGTPVLAPCECREARADNIAFALERVANLRAGVEEERPGDYCLGDYLEIIHQNEVRPDAMCRADATEGFRPDAPHCSHGATSCPTCGSNGDGVPRATPESLAAILRDIRAALQPDPLS